MRDSERVRKIVEYFKKNLLKGYTEDSLKFALVSQGYSRITVEDCLMIAHKELAEKAPKLEERPVIRHEIIDERDRVVRVRHKSIWEKLLGI